MKYRSIARKRKMILRRNKVLRFLERIVLPFMISGLLVLIGLIVAVTLFHVQFRSTPRMLIILGIIIVVIGDVIFAIAQAIIEKIMKL